MENEMKQEKKDAGTDTVNGEGHFLTREILKGGENQSAV